MTQNNAPVGIFDSGLGGLTVVKAVMKNMPGENIVYLGDSLNVPYGDKTPEQIKEFACKNVEFLLSEGVKAIAVACNTVDSVALEMIKERYDVPVVGVVGPASKKAASLSENRKIGVIATKTAISSGAYERNIRAFLADCEVFSVAAPLLVPLVEQGKINKGDRETEEALREYLIPLKEKGIDTLVLGCTHYPLLIDIVKDIVPDMNIVCSGESSIGSLKEILKENGIENPSEEKGTAQFFVTGEISYFEKNGGLFLETSLQSKVKKAVL